MVRQVHIFQKLFSGRMINHKNHFWEITNFVKLGMTPYDAIQSATIIGAELLGIDKITGTLSIGKEADIIAITNNPLTNIQNIQDVVFVMNILHLLELLNL